MKRDGDLVGNSRNSGMGDGRRVKVGLVLPRKSSRTEVVSFRHISA